MKTRYIILIVSLLSAVLAMCYNGTHFYHELVNPQAAVPSAVPASIQPGKQVTTFSFTVCREVVAAPTPKASKSANTKRVVTR